MKNNNSDTFIAQKQHSSDDMSDYMLDFSL